ncbi:MAG: SulP family inorganic anion transporter, partial [Pseudomonadota bacterium]
FSGSTFISELDPTVVWRADWWMIFQQTPLILAVIALTLLGTVLNISGLEEVFERDLNTDKDLRATGLANIGSAVFGGLPGFQSVTEPIIAKNLGVTGRLPGYFGAAGCLLALVFGASTLGSLPVGVFGALLIFIGIDLLWTWLKDTWDKLSRFDYAVVAGIVLVAGTAGFLWAVFVGLVAAIILFLLTYAKIDSVRSRTTLASERSRVERPMGELSWLADHGDSVVILHLNGFIFFGTAHALRETVRRELFTVPTPRAIILDFTDVQGLDVSAIQSLARIVRDAHKAPVDLYFVQVDEEQRSQIIKACAPVAAPRFKAEKDAALEVAEQLLLADMPKPAGPTARMRLIRVLLDLIEKDGPVERLELAPETVLFQAGTESRDLYLLLQGQMRAMVERLDGTRVRVAQFRHGALIGELAHYADGVRTADVISETQVEILRIDIERLERVNPDIAGDVHRYAAGVLARRVISTTTLARSMLSK